MDAPPAKKIRLIEPETEAPPDSPPPPFTSFPETSPLVQESFSSAAKGKGKMGAELEKFETHLQDLYLAIEKCDVLDRKCDLEGIVGWLGPDETAREQFVSFIFKSLTCLSEDDLLTEAYAGESWVVLNLFREAGNHLPAYVERALTKALEAEIELIVTTDTKTTLLPSLTVHLALMMEAHDMGEKGFCDRVALIFQRALQSLQKAYFPLIPITKEEAIELVLTTVHEDADHTLAVDPISIKHDYEREVWIAPETMFARPPGLFYRAMDKKVPEKIKKAYRFLVHIFCLHAEPDGDKTYADEEE